MSKDLNRPQNEIATTIRVQNDAFRKAGWLPALGVDGRKVHTSGIADYSPEVIADIWRQVAAFDAFAPENDPHGEHDFGAFDHPAAGRVFWKIDYYDPSYEFGADDPADPSTKRVLTVMLAEEY